MTNFGDFISAHKKGIDSGKYPDYHPDIKLISTDKFDFKVYRKSKDSLDNPVVGDKTINKNRTTYWVPNVQK